ncbi:MAG: hypothetical protein R3C10_08575 [Pirellulales bacterium]
MSDSPHADGTSATLSSVGRQLVLWSAFLGWMFAGVEMQLVPLATRSAITSFVADGTLAIPAATVDGNDEGNDGNSSDAAAVAQKKSSASGLCTTSRHFCWGPRWGGSCSAGWAIDPAAPRRWA